ncbi:hypothetical protein RFI_27758 [Reticulomyxa filosa]|uniref:Uncharacterized protein n=1 Tax=Reticulomyxa filosa TaxID=46433 RepID=X6M6J9_RETFI|nr:hypothetical protein RFI_27758 [Reticulomyxa filosa]|eukprot:ETO09618.1 hypothetical protein RFI_27758 [Reticulomyxa filosa]
MEKSQHPISKIVQQHLSNAEKYSEAFAENELIKTANPSCKLIVNQVKRNDELGRVREICIHLLWGILYYFKESKYYQTDVNVDKVMTNVVYELVRFVFQTRANDVGWSYQNDMQVIKIVKYLLQMDMLVFDNEHKRILLLKNEKWKVEPLQIDNRNKLSLKYNIHSEYYNGISIAAKHRKLFWNFCLLGDIARNFFDERLQNCIEMALVSTVKKGLPFIEKDSRIFQYGTRKKKLSADIASLSTLSVHVERLLKSNKNTIEGLDMKKHSTANWLKANAEAAKIVKKMIRKNKNGIVIVTNGISEWKERITKLDLIKINKSDTGSFLMLLDDNKTEKKQIGEYWIYAIKRKLIILQDINIDGNVYAVNCDIQCKGKVDITTQLYVTKKAKIDQKLKQTIAPIQWNTKIHYNVLLKIRDLSDKRLQCSKKNLLDDAIAYAQEYISFSIKIFGSNHPFVADGYNDLGLSLHSKCKYDKAFECFEKALTISLLFFEANHIWIGNIYSNLFSLHNSVKQFDKAAECGEKYLQNRINLFGANHREVASVYDLLLRCYDNMKQYEKAMEFHDKALEIRLNISDLDHNGAIDAYNNLGELYRDYDQYDIATKCHEKAVKFGLDTFGANHLNVAKSYHMLGNCYYRKMQYDKAIECHKKALDIRKQILGNINLTVKDSYLSLADSCKDAEKKEAAFQYYKEAWKITSIICGEWNNITWQAKEHVKELMMTFD